MGSGKRRPLDGAEVHGAQLAVIQHEVELVVLGLLIGGGEGARADDGAGNGLGAEPQLNARAFELVEHARHTAAADLKGKLAEFMAQGIHRVVAQSGDLAAAAGADGERLEYVVHFRGVEIQSGGFAGRQSAGAFEEADAVLVQDHLLDGKVGRKGCGDAEDQADRNARFHIVSNGGMPRSAASFQASFHSPIAFMMTRFGRWPSNSA